MKNKKIIVLIILLTACVAVALAAYITTSGSENVQNNTESDAQEINYAPPTESEKQSGDTIKESVSPKESDESETTDPDNDPATLQPVTPIITSAGQYDDQIEVRAFIPAIFETDGQCTITFTKGSEIFTQSAAGIADATTTRCDTVVIERSNFPSSGNWQVKVTYESNTSYGESDATTVEIN